MILDYFIHKFNPKDFKLVMTILVKNESDIIEANIKTHSKLGVDAFVVMDNNSTDGTREILEKLKDDYDLIVLDEPSKEFKQKIWVTKLAKIAKTKYKADWVINSDADEFWIPKDKINLKNYLKFKGGVLKVKRTNMLPSQKSLKNDFDFYNFDLEVKNTILYNYPNSDNMSNILTKIGPKTIINPYGLIKVNSGNHSAEHIAIWKKQFTQDIHVYHYPIRSLKQFISNIEMYKYLVEEVKNVKIGKHWIRWVKLYNKGKIEEEYKKFLFEDKEIEFLKKIGILVENNIPSKILKELM